MSPVAVKMATTNDEQNNEEMSAYEKLRQANIQRNELRLKELGLDKGFPKPSPKKTTKERIVKRSRSIPPEHLRRSVRCRKTINYKETTADESTIPDDGDSIGGLQCTKAEYSSYEEVSDSDSDRDDNDNEYEKETTEKTFSSESKGDRRTNSTSKIPSTSTTANSTGGLTLELAKTGRSTCRKCKNKIEKGSPRVGMKAWIVGRQAITWQCPSCCLSNLTCGYETTGRSKCKVTGEYFTKDELKVGIRCHTATSFYKVHAIGHLLRSVAALTSAESADDSLKIDRIEGNSSLSDEDLEELQYMIGDVITSTRKQESADPNVSKPSQAYPNRKGTGMNPRSTTGFKHDKSKKQPKAGSKSGAKGKVQWKFGGRKCFGTLLPGKETKTHCFARTHKGNIKTLAKGKDYWSTLP